MKRALYAAVLAFALGACASSPQRLPVGVSLCNAVETPSGFTVSATVQNKADKPITSLGLALGFYHDFKYAQFTTATHLAKELDPGEKRDVSFTVTAPSTKERGQAMRCLVTHIGFMDGTSADLPPSQ
ncbi:MAG TPA: hypothetical protein VFH72_10940 [Candidatus Baltobacteraceae bacterium]|nr:hypothetical protein [Candidatus Baltobacteraceae bacterium]